ncbi:MAG: AraC family transcriptional regulator [Eubacteriales bacterium]|nr:AraC family transcriptional regulator [Eubacteriales bacterium]
MKPIVLNDWVTTPKNPLHSILTKDDDVLPHYHLFYEIFYIMDGSIRHTINGNEQILQPGDIVFLNLEDFHCFYRTSETSCRHRDIIIRTDFFESVCDFIGEDFKQAYMKNQLSKVITLPFEQIKRYDGMLTNIALSLDTNSAFRQANMRTFCVSLLNCLITEEIQNDFEYYPVWFKELLNRFHMNDYLQASLDQILQPFHFSRSYMCRTFQRYMGCTMTDYLNDIRLQQAAYRLQYTDDTILSICCAVGISSISYFNRIFKEKYGVSPRVFRQRREIPGGSPN